MGESLPEEFWSDERCQAWADDYDTRFKAHIAAGGEWSAFSKENVGTIPREVRDYFERRYQEMLEKRAIAQAEGEKRRRGRNIIGLPGFEIVDTDA